MEGIDVNPGICGIILETGGIPGIVGMVGNAVLPPPTEGNSVPGVEGVTGTVLPPPIAGNIVPGVELAGTLSGEFCASMSRRAASFPLIDKSAKIKTSADLAWGAIHTFETSKFCSIQTVFLDKC